jgi:tripartite-type tricarboxylate transporter receptor subunit TctC
MQLPATATASHLSVNDLAPLRVLGLKRQGAEVERVRGGTVPLGFQFLPNVIAPIQSGDALALAVASETRLAALPDVPTSAEAGLPGYISSGWLAFLAPRGTPKPIIERLHAELAAAMKDQTVRSRFAELGAEPVVTTPQELAQFIASETSKWGGIIKRGGITIEQ